MTPTSRSHPHTFWIAYSGGLVSGIALGIALTWTLTGGHA